MKDLLSIVAVLSSVGAVFAVLYVLKFKGKTVNVMPEKKDSDNESIVIEARTKAKEILLEAEKSAYELKTKAEDESRRVKNNTLDLEKNLAVKKAELDESIREIGEKSKRLDASKDSIETRKNEVEQLYKTQQEKLQSISALTKDEARKQLMESFERELAEEKGKKIREMQEEIKKDVNEYAKEILVDAMRHGATDYVVEYTVSKIKLPDEDIKGRIIGKEGRNIKTFEELSGVELDLDSSSGDMIISSFDPVRREIAKVSMEKLLADGRIQPARIEEIIKSTKLEIEQIMFKEGDNLCHRVGVYNLPKDLVQMLGRFKYRFSYGQNMIEHTLEETRIGVAIASEIGANANLVKMGCLLHDIGKVVNDEEGTHVQLGVDLLKKYKIAEDVINCVAEHHEDRPFSSLESAIVNLADHVSGARPGARSEDYETYVKRMKDLEDAATSFDGVDKVFAISAGREVRVFVKPDVVDDSSTAFLAREIAKKIELEQTYPGTVKVTVIRETRVSETAK